MRSAPEAPRLRHGSPNARWRQARTAAVDGARLAIYIRTAGWEAIAMRRDTRYAESGDVNIAYQVIGQGPLDLIFVPGWVSNVDVAWEEPRHAYFRRRLASLSRLILFDRRGSRLSDRGASLPTLEERMDDVRAVTYAVGTQRAALFGYRGGGPMCLLFAAPHPGHLDARCVDLAVDLCLELAKGDFGPDVWQVRSYPDGRSEALIGP